MYRKEAKGWLKHYDFFLVDFIAIQLALYFAYLIRYGLTLPYQTDVQRTLAITYGLVMICVVFFTDGYNGILRRKVLKEARKSFELGSLITLLNLSYFYMIKQSTTVPRGLSGVNWVLSILLIFGGRLLWKNVILHLDKGKSGPSLLLVAHEQEAPQLIEKVVDKNFARYHIAGVVLMEEGSREKTVSGVPVVGNMDELVDYVQENWVDEVLFYPQSGETVSDDILSACTRMGVTIHMAVEPIINQPGQKTITRIGEVSVVSNSVKAVSPYQLFWKRVMDILGGIVGCLLTGVLFIFVAPMIKMKSPGPVFFSQERVGKNGRKFKIYKFRSMYMDAEERKKELMQQNEVNGLMFKMDDDPRIIKGIGHFIRKSSIDEFPQFWNVLKGDMSLVGTRPPTVDEYVQYDQHHRKRLAIKPGLTGMWQVSGRSDIKDFEEVVRLDVKYIREWSLGLDIWILFKTVKIVLTGEGSK